LPTFGWVREDDLEAFYEGTERFPDPVPPSGPSYRCPFCLVNFPARLELQTHVAKEHKVERPILLIKGNEPSHRTTVRSKVVATDVYLQNASVASMSVNGGSSENVAISDISDKLAALTDGELTITLVNNDQQNATPVASTYELSIRVASAKQLKGVESSFDEIILSEELTRAAIGDFLDDQRTQGPAAEYAIALADYAMGVLLKERPGTESLTTPFSRYREAYGSALPRLSDFDRPLARLITNIIRFAMNDFSSAVTKTGFWELDVANEMLKDPMSNVIESFGKLPAVRKPICPVDHGTGQILALAERMSSQDRWSPILNDECRRASETDVLDAMDQQKVLAIWAASAWRLDAKESALEPLRQIAATYPFRTWAEPYLESMSK
tara:strand:- start:18109 stop:19260 length:1152 start_codon:yes stop_codon:yes gene_type:complete